MSKQLTNQSWFLMLHGLALKQQCCSLSWVSTIFPSWQLFPFFLLIASDLALRNNCSLLGTIVVVLLNKAKKHNIRHAIIIVLRLVRGQRSIPRQLPTNGTCTGTCPRSLYFLLPCHFCGFQPIFIRRIFFLDLLPVAYNWSVLTNNICLQNRQVIIWEYQNKN